MAKKTKKKLTNEELLRKLVMSAAGAGVVSGPALTFYEVSKSLEVRKSMREALKRMSGN